jgi:hypothetical protein
LGRIRESLDWEEQESGVAAGTGEQQGNREVLDRGSEEKDESTVLFHPSEAVLPILYSLALLQPSPCITAHTAWYMTECGSKL